MGHKVFEAPKVINFPKIPNFPKTPNLPKTPKFPIIPIEDGKAPGAALSAATGALWWGRRVGLETGFDGGCLCLVTGFLEEGEHVFLVGLDSGLVEGVDIKEVT